MKAVEAAIKEREGVSFETRFGFSQRETKYFGRNSQGRCTGTNVSVEGDNEITLRPVNSRGDITDACILRVPLEDLDSLVLALNKMRRQKTHSAAAAPIRSARNYSLI